METWDAYRSRRNVRAFTEQRIDAELLHRIVDAGRRAPSAFNSQPWDFVLVTEPARLSELATVWQGAGHIAHSAATIVVLAPHEPDADRARWAEFDRGQAMMAMAVVAADLGIGSGHALIDDQERLRRVIGSPATHRGAYLLAFGYPADRPLAPIERLNRRPFDEVVHREQW